MTSGIFQLCRGALLGAVIAWALPAAAQSTSNTGVVAVLARASGYMDITAGGPTVLSGSVGGSIANNKVQGEVLTGLAVQLGEVGPMNRNAFVKVTLPLLLRSNTGYALSMSATPIVSADPGSVRLTDIGFGMGNVSRSAPYVMPGTDTPVGSILGDPTTTPDANPATPRWDYPSGNRLSDYTTTTGIIGGTRILTPVPASVTSGLTLDLYFCLKPQFFSPGNFSTTITLTISSP